MALREALADAVARLSDREDLRRDAARDAELLLLHTLGAPRTLLFTDPGRLMTVSESATYAALIDRRLTSEPIQYITGEQEFYGLALKVTRAVLIPRHETELLVEAVLERLPKDRQVKIADVGTGSGAIAIALAKHLPLAQVTALDLSHATLEVARENAARHLDVGRVQFLHSDLFREIAEGERFDAIVSNPPYVPEPDRDSLHPQVREFEPASALFAGRDGLDIYRRLVPQAYRALREGGLLAMEIGHGQRDALAKLLAGWSRVEFLDDLQGIPRVVLAHSQAG